MKTKFYSIDQNNSGGSFVTNDKLCHRIIIEAKDENEATVIAEGLGCYWNGVADDMDCECCGDRWSSPSSYDVVDLDKYKREGYNVNIYSHSKESEWFDKYGHYPIKDEPKWEKVYSQRQFKGSIYFEDIEEYCEFMADCYGWESPDVRIFYLDGRVTEIDKMEFQERKELKVKRKLILEKR